MNLRLLIPLFLSIALLFSALYLYFSLQKMQDFPKLAQASKYLLFFEMSCFTIAILWMTWLSRNHFALPRNPFIVLAMMMAPLSLLIFSLFLGLEDLLYGLKCLYTHVKNWIFPQSTPSNVSRSEFLLQTGFWLSTLPLGAALLSLKQAHAYKIHRIHLHSSKIPPAFQGFKILQLSDIHVGSFWNFSAVQKGIELALAQKPDLIVFTGDLVNNEAKELREDYRTLFAQLQAPYGVYSVLGNHDYGDYQTWSSKEAKAENLQKLKDSQRAMGWRLLLNEHVQLEKEGQKINLIGVENWGLHGFAQYGDLHKAYQRVSEKEYTILLSHDPSHWRGQVLPQFPHIDLTLSGHTHGFQFGIETPFFRFSPVQFRYPEWAGLYEQGQQALYVNRGFGYIGFPGRVGIVPEITLIELG